MLSKVPLEPLIEIVNHAPDTQKLMDHVAAVDHGANVLFTGTVRRMTGSHQTAWLEYECYESMAIAVMRSIALDIRSRFDGAGIAISHRIGKVLPGQTSIAIATATGHRESAFEAARMIMDAVKLRVPVWKKDVSVDGSESWVEPVGASTNEAWKVTP